ncbi:hypothetical protein ON05_001445 [Acaryochloris sp. CCMEE 5410]|nr:hypothetical protein ON05_001445 [Acaryochloris sp. CCMEE 5410]
MKYTPFAVNNAKANNFFRQHNIEFTDSASDCDLFITRRNPGIRKRINLMIKYGDHPILLWTHEPRFNTDFCAQLKSYSILPKFYIMNVYTGDIHISNYTIYSWAIREKVPLIQKINNSAFLNKTRCIAFLSTYIPQPEKFTLTKDNRNINLTEIRQNLGIAGYRKGLVDIYGKDWPNGMSVGESRNDNWLDSKQDILKKYDFNLCLENTNFDYYCTEKIWDSIAGSCLPIYFGKYNRIYETFPKNSFIDVADFYPHEDIFNFVENMTEDEYIERLNLCISVYNNLADNRDRIKYKYQKMLVNIIERINEILS